MQLLDHEPVTRPDLQTQVRPGLEIQELPNGEAAAALVSAGIGALALGVFTTLAEFAAPVKTFLTFNAAVGPLSGKTILPVLLWLVAWAGLYIAWRGKEVPFGRVFAATLIGIGLGLLGTFPIFFELFAP